MSGAAPFTPEWAAEVYGPNSAMIEHYRGKVVRQEPEVRPQLVKRAGEIIRRTVLPNGDYEIQVDGAAVIVVEMPDEPYIDEEVDGKDERMSFERFVEYATAVEARLETELAQARQDIKSYREQIYGSQDSVAAMNELIASV